MAKRNSYSAESKVLLAELVKKYPLAVNKQSGGPALDKKRRAWEKIQEEFAADALGQSVSVKALKDLWRNMKKHAITDVSETRLSLLKTGGGPPEKEISPLSELVIATEPQHFAPVTSNYDCDVITLEPLQDESVVSSLEISVGSDESQFEKALEKIQGECSTSSNPSCLNEGIETPYISKKRKPVHLKSVKKSPYKERIDLYKSQQQYTTRKLDAQIAFNHEIIQMERRKMEMQEEILNMKRERHQEKVATMRIQRALLERSVKNTKELNENESSTQWT